LKKAALCLLTLTFLFVPSAFAALKPGDPAPTFSLRDPEGKEFFLSEVIGRRSKEKTKGVILSFFASWCVPCRTELPLLNSLVDELKSKGVLVVIIDLKEDSAVVADLLRELKVDKPIALLDRYGKTAEKYQVRFLPTTFFIGADGKVKGIIFGEIKDATELKGSAEKLLQ
jgi:thiol-disulfide isomerase/thioredoxin